MFRLIKAEVGTEYVDVPHGENVLGRGPFLKVKECTIMYHVDIYAPINSIISDPLTFLPSRTNRLQISESQEITPY